MATGRPNASAGPVRLNAGTAAPLITGEAREELQSDYRAAVAAVEAIPGLSDADVSLGEKFAAVGYGYPAILDQLRNAAPPPPGNEEYRNPDDGRKPTGNGYTTKETNFMMTIFRWLASHPFKQDYSINFAFWSALIAGALWWFLSRRK